MYGKETMPKPAAIEPSAPSEESDPVLDDASHRALYRRWRAQRFGELIGQDPIEIGRAHV